MSLVGRIQTRVLLILVIGIPWTLLFALVAKGDDSYGEALTTMFLALGTALLAGVVLWEPIYHAIQQRRWDRDWPMLLGLLTGLNEGALVALALHLADRMSVGAFITHFTVMWVLVWLAANGPLRVLLPRWRYRGGRVL